jgi:DNA-binding NtrC family response regulator
MDKSKFRLLVVDHERALGAGVQETLRHEGYTVDTANDARMAFSALRTQSYHLVLADMRMPEMSGLQLRQQVQRAQTDAQFILMTSGTTDGALEAMKSGAYDYVTKPVDAQRLRLLVAKALAYQNVLTENNELRRRLKQRSEPSLLVGECESIRRILRVAHEVASSEVTVLIEGESGTGKELVAQTIHGASPRAAKPFVSVNCAAFADQVLEGEWFGQVKSGSGSAAMVTPGQFQMAKDGTLFLDEIGELSPKGQGDLLRVLEEGAFRMAGGGDLIRMNARIIAATNKCLRDAVTAGKFREDLYHRLQVVPITVPPLRERADDIPLLIEAFLEHFSVKHKRRRKKFSAEAMQRCRQFAWPGNVRQLRNTIERLVVTCGESIIEAEYLPDFLHLHDGHTGACEIHAGMTVADCEKLLIRETLTHATTNREQAARLLGISRRALQYKLKSYGLLAPKRDLSFSPSAPDQLSGAA